MKTFHQIVLKAKKLANERQLQGKLRIQAIQNYVIEQLNLRI